MEQGTTGSPGPAPGAAAEWRRGWTIVLAAFFGVGLAAVESRILGVMMKPLTETFGWSRSQISLAPLLLSGGTLVVSPLVGSIVDRFGARTVALCGVPLFSGLLALLALSQGNLALFYALFALTALVGPAVGPIVWSLGVAGAFRASRGAALGVAMSGIAAFGTLTPLVTLEAYRRFGIDLFWVAMGLYCLVLAFPLALLFFRAPSSRPARLRGTSAGTNEADGTPFAQALRSSRFWRMTLGVGIAAAVCGMFSVHFVAMLTDRAMSPGQAALMFGAMGPATMAGRLLGGYLLDRIFAPFVAAGTLVLPLAACLIMLTVPVATPALAIPVALFVGFALGTEGDTVAYLASRYFGLRHYGKIYGMMFGLYGLGFGAGSFIGGAAYDATGSYDAAFGLFAGLLVAAIILLATLGPYPSFVSSSDRTSPRHA